jgi:hypothetical protein
MGKKAGKRKADNDGNQSTATWWKAVDKDPVALLVAPKVRSFTIMPATVAGGPDV